MIPAILLLASFSTAAPLQAEEFWTVSCSQDSKVIYRQKMDVPVGEFDTSVITERYPDAACIFMAPAEAYPTPVLTPGDAGDLDAALRAITGSDPTGYPALELPLIPASVAPAPDLGLIVEPTTPDVLTTPEAAISESESEDLVPITSPPRFRPKSPNWVRLATYRTDDVAVALEDWASIAGSEIAFRRLTPSLTSTDDGYITLSAGPAETSERDAICIAASGYGLDCIWGEGEEKPLADTSAQDYLAYLFPDHVLPPSDSRQCVRKDALSMYQEVNMPGRAAGYTCWTDPLAAPLTFPVYKPGLSNIKESVATGMPPMPRPRPARQTD